MNRSRDWVEQSLPRRGSAVSLHDRHESGRRDSNPRPPPWQGGSPPTEILPHENRQDAWRLFYSHAVSMSGRDQASVCLRLPVDSWSISAEAPAPSIQDYAVMEDERGDLSSACAVLPVPLRAPTRTRT